MYRKNEGDTTLDQRTIDGVEDKINRDAHQVLINLDNTLRSIGSALLFNMDLDDVAPAKKDHTKNDMVINTSTLMKNEETLVKDVVELAKKLCTFAKHTYKKLTQPDVIPTSIIRMGRHWDALSVSITQSSTATDRLAVLTGYNKSDSRPLIKGCCELVIAACELQKDATTKYTWENLPDDKHPDGMIGHTYDVLWAYGIKSGEPEHAKDFRNKFQNQADTDLKNINELEEKVEELMKEVQSRPPTPGDAEQALLYLEDALGYSKSASRFVKEVSDYIRGLFLMLLE